MQYGRAAHVGACTVRKPFSFIVSVVITAVPESCGSIMILRKGNVLALLSLWVTTGMAAVFSEADYTSGAIHERMMGIEMVSRDRTQPIPLCLMRRRHVVKMSSQQAL